MHKTNTIMNNYYENEGGIHIIETLEIIPLATLLLFSCLSFSVFIGFQTLVQIHKEAFIIKKDERPSPIKLFLTSYRKTGHRVWCFFVFAIIFALIFGSYITEKTIVHELHGEEIDIKSQEIQWTFKILYTLTLSSITIGYLIAFLFIQPVALAKCKIDI